MVIEKAPVKKVYTRKFYDTREIPRLWWNEQKRKGRDIRDVQAEHYADGNGQIGIVYHECTSSAPESVSLNFSCFIPERNSLGLTQLGLKMMQQAIESYVYSILGAQARTRWEIVDAGARSLQTQDVFRKLVRDTVLEQDTTKSVSNMRQAIQDTNVVLNKAVSPGMILVPSNMMIVKEKTPGWNNILTLATDKMLFGTNTQVNKKTRVKRSLEDSSQHTSQQASQHTLQTTSQNANNKNVSKIQQKPESNVGASNYILIGVVTSLAVKLIVYLI